jgi:hypothetical protein
MISSQPSSEPSPNRLPPNHASGPHQILTNSAPGPPRAAARPLVQMPAADTPCDRAHSTALVAACQRIWAAPDVVALWRIVVDEAVALIAADGVASSPTPSASGKLSPHARATRRRMIRPQLR